MSCRFSNDHDVDEGGNLLREHFPCDFFLWGYLKSLVYNERPNTLARLKNNIQAAIDNIPEDMLVRVEKNFKTRIAQCTYKNGDHLNDIIFKT